MDLKTTLTVTTLILIFQLAFSQIGMVDRSAEKKPSIVFIGTYHMGNQGNNVFKGSYDDILSQERQEELQILIQKLKDFKPTKILVERDVSDSSEVLARYKKYLAGNYQLTRNEVHQIGFRLAKELRHNKVYSVDWGIFPEDQLYWYENFAKTIPELDNYYKDWKKAAAKRHKESNEELLKLTIIERIRRLNEEESIEKSHLGYYDIMRIGWKDKYVGANYLSWWYGRNMKILVNIIRITESPDDRILVIYGNGHSKLLNQLTKESQFYNVIKPMEILKD
nr:DUF5694 domain-containing protein [Allomuricauda sp.]